MTVETVPAHLSAVLKRYPHTARLMSREIADPRVQLNFVQVDPIYRAFAPMARAQTYDVSEMAIVTYLQAKAYGKPLLLLPTVIAARLQRSASRANSTRRIARTQRGARPRNRVAR